MGSAVDWFSASDQINHYRLGGAATVCPLIQTVEQIVLVIQAKERVNLFLFLVLALLVVSQVCIKPSLREHFCLCGDQNFSVKK